MTSVQSSLDADPDEVDLSGLVESIVDSDEEEDLAESMDVSIMIYLAVPRDALDSNFCYCFRV